MSKRIEQATRIMSDLKDKVYQQASINPEGVSRKEYEDMCRGTFKSVAGVFHVQESTIRDKVTRGLGINTETFYKESWDSLTGDPDLRSRLREKACDDDDDRLIDAL